MKLKLFFKNVLVFGNILFALLLLIACFVPYIDSAKLAFLGLLAPVLILGNLFYALFWLLKQRAFFLLSFALVVLSYFCLGTFIRINFNKEPPKETDLRIMSFNARVFNRNEDIDQDNIPEQILDFVAEQSPDILCFQEFRYTYKDHLPQYPYYRISYEKGRQKVMHAIFSKYPIVQTQSLAFPNSSNEGVYSDIVYQKDTLRIYNLHLESFRVKPNAKAISSESSNILFNRLSNAFAKQQEQAALTQKHLKQSPYLNIVCGDFNNTQSSYSYKKIRGNMLDTFDEKGHGFGKTFNFFKLPFRIDFILVDPKITVVNHTNYEVLLSDHLPLMSTLRIPHKK